MSLIRYFLSGQGISFRTGKYFGLAVLVGIFAGFVVVGLGASNIIPILFSIASHQKIMPVNLAISSVTTLGYLGLLMGPPIMGFIAHASSLYAVFGIVAGLMIFVGIASRGLHKL